MKQLAKATGRSGLRRIWGGTLFTVLACSSSGMHQAGETGGSGGDGAGGGAGTGATGGTSGNGGTSGSGGASGSGGSAGAGGKGGSGGTDVDAGAGGAAGETPDAAVPDARAMRDRTPMPIDTGAASDAMGASPDMVAACTLQMATFINDKPTTGGGMIFAATISDPQAFIKEIALKDCLILYDNVADVKKVPKVTLEIQDPGNGVAATGGATTGFNAAYIAGFKGDVNFEIHGVVSHEFTHIYQNNKTNTGWLIEGIADYVRYRAGYIPLKNRHKGGNYTDAYQTTAFFLVWLDDQYPGFGRKLNAAMKGTANEQTFQMLTGKPIAQLWSEYQAAIP